MTTPHPSSHTVGLARRPHPDPFADDRHYESRQAQIDGRAGSMS
jgi:hypothetical protein